MLECLLMKSTNSEDKWKYCRHNLKLLKYILMWRTSRQLHVVTKVLQIVIDKIGLFLKSITLEVKVVHFVLFLYTLLILVWQKQPKPCSCTHLQVINKIHRKVMTKMNARPRQNDKPVHWINTNAPLRVLKISTATVIRRDYGWVSMSPRALTLICTSNEKVLCKKKTSVSRDAKKGWIKSWRPIQRPPTLYIPTSLWCVSWQHTVYRVIFVRWKFSDG